MPTLIVDSDNRVNCSTATVLTGLKPGCTQSYDPISPCLCEENIYQEEPVRFLDCECFTELADALIDGLGGSDEELLACLEQIKEILSNPMPIDIGVTETPWCTLDCEPLFLCKIINEETGEISWDFHVAVPGETQLQSYAGERRLCVECNQTPKEGFDIGTC